MNNKYKIYVFLTFNVNFNLYLFIMFNKYLIECDISTFNNGNNSIKSFFIFLFVKSKNSLNQPWHNYFKTEFN